MPFEIRFYGDDPGLTIREVRALLNLGFAVEADKGALTASAPPKESEPRRTRVVETASAPPKESKPRRTRVVETAPVQVDLEEAIADATAAQERELDDDISDVASTDPEDKEYHAEPATKDDVRNALIALMKAKGEDAPTALLKKHFKVSKIGELKESDYAAVVSAASAASNE